MRYQLSKFYRKSAQRQSIFIDQPLLRAGLQLLECLLDEPVRLRLGGFPVLGGKRPFRNDLCVLVVDQIPDCFYVSVGHG